MIIFTWLEIFVYRNETLLYTDVGGSRKALRRAAREELGSLDTYIVFFA